MRSGTPNTSQRSATSSSSDPAPCIRLKARWPRGVESSTAPRGCAEVNIGDLRTGQDDAAQVERRSASMIRDICQKSLQQAPGTAGAADDGRLRSSRRATGR